MENDPSEIASIYPILPVIFEDEYLVAINKPHNLLVHRTKIAEEKTHFAVQILKKQLGFWVSPCHRIDRKTSGVLLFAKTKEAHAAMSQKFSKNEISKKYFTLVRGFVPDSGHCDRPLENEKGKLQEALTHFKCIQQIELPIAVSRYPTSRYSLVEVCPQTGRTHQIRIHFAQMRHYIIGDKTHGECKQNKMFETKFGLDTMLLHAAEISFLHPVYNQNVVIKATINQSFATILNEIGFESIMNSLIKE